jgi:DNA polymerase I-like protein with 3'-5' exonuclease and polymerase domains
VFLPYVSSHPGDQLSVYTVVLGVGYGMEAESLAGRTGVSPLEARELLRKHRETYPRFWDWSAMLWRVRNSRGRPVNPSALDITI